MFAASICHVFKRLTFQDWTIFNERYAQAKVLGQTNARKDSEEGRAMASLVENFSSDMGMVIYESQPGERAPVSLIGPNGAASVELFERFLERQDRKMTVMFRGSDLRNMSRGGDVTGVSAQIDETESLEIAHCQNIADACRTYIDRAVIRYCFGEDVEPLAYFGLPDTDAENAAELRANAGFLADRGALVELETVAERLGVTLTDDPDAALKRAGASEEPATLSNEAPSEDGLLPSTANGAYQSAPDIIERIARLQSEVLKVRQTGNANSNHDRIGRFTFAANKGSGGNSGRPTSKPTPRNLPKAQPKAKTNEQNEPGRHDEATHSRGSGGTLSGKAGIFGETRERGGVGNVGGTGEARSEPGPWRDSTAARDGAIERGSTSKPGQDGGRGAADIGGGSRPGSHAPNLRHADEESRSGEAYEQVHRILRRGLERVEQVAGSVENQIAVGHRFLKAAVDQGIVPLTKHDPSKLFAESGEHLIELTNDRKRVLKHTRRGKFGFHPYVTRGGNIGLRPATAGEYLERLKAHNRHFRSDFRLEGVHRYGGGGFSVSQTYIRGLPPLEHELKKYLGDQGFVKINSAGISSETLENTTYFHPDLKIIVGDAKTDNFIRTRDGTIHPIDLMVAHVPHGSRLHKTLMKGVK